MKNRSVAFFLSVLLLLVVLCSLAAAPAFAQNWPFLKNAQPHSGLVTLVSATTTTGVTGSAVSLGVPFKDITCMVTNPSGSVPSGVNMRLDGSLDGTNFVTQMTNSTSTFPTVFSTASATAVPWLYIRGAYVSRVSGNTNSMLKLECLASH